MTPMLTPMLLAVQLVGGGWPAVAADGRIVFEANGDLYLMQADAAPRRITSGGAIDRQPAWSMGGDAIVFVSDRAGQADLWRVRIATDGSTGEPEQLTRTPEPELEPATAPDGSIVFARVQDGRSALWVRTATGEERQLTRGAADAASPAVSADGVIAYVSTRDNRRTLRTVKLDGTDDRGVSIDQQPEFPAWSRDGRHIAFNTGGPRGAVWITGATGGYANLVSRTRGKAVFTARGDSLLIASLSNDPPSYNGDPDRIRDRDAQQGAILDGNLRRVAVPLPPDAGLVDLGIRPEFDEQSRAALFDRTWQRVADLYFRNNHAASSEWQALRETYRPRALAARTPDELDRIVHEMVRKRPPARAEATGRAAVSSAHPLATEAGLEILRKGGNVVDAAIAVSFALGVVEPDASGVGGYGQMIIHLDGMPQPELLEFMTRAPEEASLDNAGLATASGPAVANIPGTVDGMWRAWQRHGSKNVPWADLLAPAIRLAEIGYVLDDAFPTTLRRERDEYMKHESTRALFFPNGKPLQPGDTLKNPDLAWTLREIARGGADAFYRGEIAKRMVADLRGKGNAMTLRDMSRYYAEWRTPVQGTYRGHTLFSSAPPVSGGATLVAQLNTLEQFANPQSATEDAATLHAQIEAWKLAPRARVADPGLWPVDIAPAISKDSAKTRWQCLFDATRATQPRDLDDRAKRCPGEPTRVSEGNNGGAEGAPEDAASTQDCDVANLNRVCRSTGTTAFAVADAAGNMVSVTQTLGTWGGNFYVTPGLGFLYNDKLRSYGSNADAFGARLPNARHGSTIAPTLVFRGTGANRKPLLAAGAAGNAWITAAVFQIVTAVIDGRLGPQAALEHPRFLPSNQAGLDGVAQSVMQIESGYSPAVLQQLEKLGHRFIEISLPGELRMGYGAAVMIDGKTVRAGGDPRRSGTGGAIQP